VAADLQDPEKAGATYDGMAGQSTFEQGIAQFISGDLVIHRWDLARAVGADDRMDPDEVSRFLAFAKQAEEQFGDAMRGPQAFGPALEPPAGADEQTRLLAFLGRRAW
jgi:uncharacterized protein (TIGR03086 family)